MATVILFRIAGRRERDETRYRNSRLSMLQCALRRAHFYFILAFCLFYRIFK